MAFMKFRFDVSLFKSHILNNRGVASGRLNHRSTDPLKIDQVSKKSISYDFEGWSKVEKSRQILPTYDFWTLALPKWIHGCALDKLHLLFTRVIARKLFWEGQYSKTIREKYVAFSVFS